ncbi:MAG: class I SAM-dependent methyltransferase [Acidimicrobiia bacterium]
MRPEANRSSQPGPDDGPLAAWSVAARSMTARSVAARLAAAGFVAAERDADELLAASAGDPDRLASMLARRLHGEPLAWIVGATTFCGLRLEVHTGVYVPRPQSEALAEAAAAHLPACGVAVDVCTGCGALAAVLQGRRPLATVVATDRSVEAVANARANGVDARQADLLRGLSGALAGRVDVLVGVVPYVPTGMLGLLHRDALAFEPLDAYDGGPDGTGLLRRVLHDARALLRPGGLLLLELGGDQLDALLPLLGPLGYRAEAPLLDDEGDVRALVARLGAGRQ